MAKGNPNIAEYGKNTRFGSERGCDPVEAGRKGNETQAVMRSYYDVASALVTLEDRAEHIEKLKELAAKGDIKALELLLRILKEYEDKLNVDTTVSINVELDDEY